MKKFIYSAILIACVACGTNEPVLNQSQSNEPKYSWILETYETVENSPLRAPFPYNYKMVYYAFNLTEQEAEQSRKSLDKERWLKNVDANVYSSTKTTKRRL